MNSLGKKLFVGMGVVAMCTAFAQAGPWDGTGPGPGPYAFASGTAPSGHFSWTAGGDEYGLFGNPIVTGDDRFVFNTASMGVDASFGGTDHEEDTVSFDLHMAGGWSLTRMVVDAHGSYYVKGDSAGDKSWVNIQAGLSIVEFAAQAPFPDPRDFSAGLTATPLPFPIEDAGVGEATQGVWGGDAEVDLSFVMPEPDDDLHVSFANILDALASATGTAQGNLTFEQVQFEIVLIPEPSTLALLAIGGLALIRRRR